MKSLRQHTDYGNEGLTEEQAGDDPIALFESWLEQAEQAEIYEPNAMVLSTIDADGRPSSRTVLLKDITNQGFVFVTNHDSRKGRALDAHPQVSAVFGWYALKHQVILEGVVTRADAGTSDELWNRRPHGAKLASMASAQSHPIASREELDGKLAALESRFAEGTNVPRPDFWGAFVIRPSAIEFWAGRSMRFHDRIRFEATNTGWIRTRLQP